MTTREIQLLPAQMELVADVTSPTIALVAGLGAGKTRGLVWKSLDLATRNDPGQPVLFVGLSYRMLSDVVLPFFREVFQNLGVKYAYRKQDSLLEFCEGRTIALRSGDRPDSIQGLNPSSVLVDETALQKRRLIQLAVMRSGRLRSKVNQMVFGGTPEGFNHFYEICHQTGEWKNAQVKVIRARTQDNIFLAPGYVQTRFAHLSDEDRKQYLEGEFILKGGKVYQFDRAHVFEPCDDPQRGQQLLLCDFNRTKMAWASARILDGVIHVYAEHIGTNVNTREHGEAVQRWYADNGFSPSEVTVHCDATGGYQRSFTTQTDVGILRQIGFQVRRKARNPRVEDRINSVNEAFRRGLLKIDRNRCPYVSDCFLRQSRDSRGFPERGQWDHGVDAVGYGVHFHYPVTGPREGLSDGYR